MSHAGWQHKKGSLISLCLWPKQIFRTSRTFTVTTVGDLTLDEINAIEGIFNIYQEEISHNEFEDLINVENFEQQLNEFQPEVEN